jgi:stage V sporulation protein D (sporulation-specific penicillin-binding protein)
MAKNAVYKTGSRCALKKKCDDACNDRRVKLLVFCVLIIAVGIVLRLYSLQVISHDKYKALADGQHNLFAELTPDRGEIFLEDKDGLYPAAVNHQAKMAYAVPKEIENPEDTAQKVSDILQVDKNDLLSKFNKSDDMYEVIKHKLTDDEISKVNNLGVKGIHLADESYRYYPSGELASNVLGFVGWQGDDFKGRYGEESFFDQQLKGTAGQVTQKRDASGGGILIGDNNLVQAQNGDNVVMTINHTVQYETEKILKAAVEKNNADSGSIIVMEPQTGKILAMANYPTYDPNNYAQVEDISVYRNTAVSDAYESGSVFKAITMAAGLDSGVVDPGTTYTDMGAVKEAGYTIRNSDLKANGIQTMTNVLEKSLNTGVIFVEKKLGNKNFADYVRRFGFGELTGIEAQGEAAGNIRNLNNLKSNIQFFTAAFGQGIAVTPIQLISAYSAIANGGVLMKPQIVDKMVHPDGSEDDTHPQEVRRVISEKAATLLAQMLRSVVTNGHGKRADVPGYLVAGKTGTAQVASTNSRGYAEGINIGSFAGFAPMNNPRFTILVRVNNPRSVDWAESSAAPAFGELMKFLLDYYDIAPTEQYAQTVMDQFNVTHNLSDYFIKNPDDDSNTITVNADQPAAQKDKKK